MSVKAARKNYLADKKPFFKHFYLTDLTILAGRTVAMQGLMVFNNYVASLELEDEDSDEEDIVDDNDKDNDKKNFEPPSLDEFSTSCSKSFVKSLSISTCVRTLEEVSLQYCSLRTVSKLIKDVSKSATRKYVRTSSRFTAATLMLKTGMRANILSHIAIFVVEETHHIILILYRRFVSKSSSTKKNGKHLRTIEDEVAEEREKKEELQSFAKITARNAARSGLAVVTGGIGAAVGTFIRPGLGTMVGATLGDTIAYVI